MTDIPKCPDYLAALLGSGVDPKRKSQAGCIGSDCAAWDRRRDEPWLGRCGKASGRAFPDPAQPEKAVGAPCPTCALPVPHSTGLCMAVMSARAEKDASIASLSAALHEKGAEVETLRQRMADLSDAIASVAPGYDDIAF